MDDYNLANVFLNHDEIQKHIVDLDSFQKIPFTELSGLGGAIAELIPQFRTVTTSTSVPMEGLFRAINPKTGEVMSDLMYESKQVADAFIGSMRQPNGEFDQTAFQKVVGVKEIETTVAAINPATLMLAAGIMAMSKKLDAIEENQKKIISFLEKEKESKLKGNLSFLIQVFEDYRFNWDNETFRTSTTTKTQDIKQEAIQNVSFYRDMLSIKLEKKKLLVSKIEVRKTMKAVIEDFQNYRLAIYCYAFASYLEIILLKNYKADYLDSILSTIKEDSYRYAELYTVAYSKLENMAAGSIESGVVKGAAVVSQGLGKFIEKIPVVERGQLDETLIATGKKLEDYKDDSVVDLLASLREMSNCQVKQFSDLIETVKELHHGDPMILVDDENVYVQLAS